MADAGADRAGSQLKLSASRTFTAAGSPDLRAVLPATASNPRWLSAETTLAVGPVSGIHKIRHVVIIMQENRSFDEYFGTYPGADGIPPVSASLTPSTAGA